MSAHLIYDNAPLGSLIRSRHEGGLTMYATYLRFGVHVHASRRAVIRAAAAKLTRKSRRDPSNRNARKRFYREMLAHHRDAQGLVHRFRL